MPSATSLSKPRAARRIRGPLQQPLASQLRVTTALTPTLVVSLALSPLPALAQDIVTPPIVARQVAQAEPTQRFAIGPQPLPSALDRFSEQTGISFAYITSQLEGVPSPGVSGELAPRQALIRLLAGTGVTFQFTSADTVTLAKAGAQDGDGPIQLGPITVEGTAEAPPPSLDPGQGYKADYTDALTRVPAEIQELPQSVSVVTQDSMIDRGVTTQDQALEGVAGVLSTGQFSARATDSFAIRGFSPLVGGPPGFVRDNGLLAFNNYVADPVLFDRFEVVKGPASFTSGNASPGGFVNRVLKTPQPENFIEGSAAGGTHGHKRVTMDANGALEGNHAFSGRLVVAYNDDAEFFRNTGDERVSVLPSVRYRGPDDFTLTLSGNIQHLDGQGFFGTPTTTEGEIPAGIKDSLLGNENFLRLDYQSAHIEADKRFANGLRLNAKGQYSHDSTEYAYIYAYQSGGIAADGDFSLFASSEEWGRESFAGEISATQEFSFVGNRSSVTIGADYADNQQDSAVRPLELIGTGNIADPVITATFPIGYLDQPFSPVISSESEQIGVFVSGLIRPLERTTVLLALRHDWLTARADSVFFPAGSADPKEVKEQAFSPQIGVSQEILDGFSIYGLYGKSFETANSLRVTADGEILDPQTGETFEVGAKWEGFDKRFGATLALFRTDLENVASPDPDNNNFSIGGQSQRNQGIEVELQGSPVDDVRLNLAYTYLDAEITESTSPGVVGVRPFDTPRHVFSASGRYDLSNLLLKGLAIGGSVYYKSEVNARVPFSDETFDAFVRLNAFLQYSPAPWVTLQLNANNITNARYVERPNRYGGFNQFGPPRNVVGTLRVKF